MNKEQFKWAGKEIGTLMWNSLLLALSAILLIGGVYNLAHSEWIWGIISIILGLLLLYRRFIK